MSPSQRNKSESDITITSHFSYKKEKYALTIKMSSKIQLLSSLSKPIIHVPSPLQNYVLFVNSEYFREQIGGDLNRSDYKIKLESEHLYSIVDFWLLAKGHPEVIQAINASNDITLLQEIAASIEQKILFLERKKAELKTTDILTAGLFGAAFGAGVGALGYSTIKPVIKPILTEFKHTGLSQRAISCVVGTLFGSAAGGGIQALIQGLNSSDLADDVLLCRKLRETVHSRIAKLQQNEHKDELRSEESTKVTPGLHQRRS